MKEKDTRLTAKQRVFYAALDCFSQYSYADTTMEMIGGKLGLTAASIYKHYKGKKAILRDILHYFSQNFENHRIPEEKILQAAKTQPMKEVLPMLLYSFGTGKELEMMLKMGRIVVNLRYEHEEVAQVFHDTIETKPARYTRRVLSQLAKAGKISAENLDGLQYVMFALAYKGFLDTLMEPKDPAYYIDLYNRSAAMLGASVDISSQ